MHLVEENFQNEFRRNFYKISQEFDIPNSTRKRPHNTLFPHFIMKLPRMGEEIESSTKRTSLRSYALQVIKFGYM